MTTGSQVRGNQLISTMESMYSGENVLIVSPDSEVLSVIEAALVDEAPDKSLPEHARFAFKNAEVRPLKPFVQPRTLLVTGQTKNEVFLTRLHSCYVCLYTKSRVHA